MVINISSAVDWWEEWQLRILVLGSLAIQLYLTAIVPLRKRTGLGYWNRLLISVVYLGGDSLVIYALTTLLNRHKGHHAASSSVTGMDGSRDLEVFWAPILLMHLGGPMTISAYNMEDNELWLQHVGVAVSQVTVIIYVFWTTWSPLADKRLFAAAVLVFVLGIFRCLEKPLALKRASSGNLVIYFIPPPRTQIATTPSREVELEKFIQEARSYFVHNGGSSRHQQQQDPAPTIEEAEKRPHVNRLSRVNKLFVDYAYAYSDRLEKLKSLRLLDPGSAFEALGNGLSKTFDLLYTKVWRQGDGENRAPAIVFMTIPMILLPVASIVLFHMSHKQAYRGSDIKVTYLLLYITHTLNIIPWLSSLRIFKPISIFGYLKKPFRQVVRQFMGIARLPFLSVQQHSLIGVFADKKKQWFVACIMACCRQCCGIQDLLHQRWYGRTRLFLRASNITSFIITHTEDAWMNRIEDVESYWKLSDSRGHWTLERNGCQDLDILYDSLEKPLDESIILWHMATDLCYHCKGASADPELASLCRVISNYMMYLLSTNIEMLLPGSRASLFEDACRELDAILRDRDDRHIELTERVISNAAKSEKGFLHDAWLLAQGLMQLPASPGDGDDDGGKKMWSVIKGVWLEMLCFSACRCRGYLHAKSLAYGGELLTYVAILLSYAGLETFADKQQRMQLRLSKEERLKQAMEMADDIEVV